jgi:hypothetical protein
MFDMITGDTKKNIFTSNGGLYVTPDGSKFLIVDHVTEKAIKVHKSETVLSYIPFRLSRDVNE